METMERLVLGMDWGRRKWVGGTQGSSGPRNYSVGPSHGGCMSFYIKTLQVHKPEPSKLASRCFGCVRVASPGVTHVVLWWGVLSKQKKNLAPLFFLILLEQEP